MPASPSRLTTLALLASTAATSAPHVAAQLPAPPVPAQNPITTAKANLGKALFWDEQMSSTGTVACGTCHAPEFGGSDPRVGLASNPGFDGAFGTADDVYGSLGVIAHAAAGGYERRAPFPLQVQVTRRTALSVLMAPYSSTQFWDGRVNGTLRDPHTGAVVISSGASLESQVLEPPVNAVEMTHRGTTWADVEARIAASRPLALAGNVPAALATWIGQRSYPDLFQEAFGSPGVTAVRIAMAIATYERTLVPNQAPIDDWLRGNQNALTPQEAYGFAVFEQIGRCTFCHRSPSFDRPIFSDIGLRPLGEDRGRFAVTNQTRDDNTFKVPSLRNVGLRRNFFHNGSGRTLDDVIDFYVRGGDFVNPFIGIQPIGMTEQDRAALMAFLRNALTDPRVARGLPPFDHPTLFAEGSRAPKTYGQGTSGTHGRTPTLFTPEPALIGRGTLRAAIDHGVPGAPTLLLIDTARADTTLSGIRVHVALTPALLAIPTRPAAGGRGHGRLAVAHAAHPGRPRARRHQAVPAGALRRRRRAERRVEHGRAPAHAARAPLSRAISAPARAARRPPPARRRSVRPPRRGA